MADPVPLVEGKPVDTPSHDAAYEAFFAMVGGPQKTETYEDLARVLPSLKSTDPVELKELASREALRAMMKPKVDPLRLEYEQAAAEEDVDDLPTEEGDWIDAGGPKSADDEELDENGIPLVKLARATSSSILDGPGDVKVDNFTPEDQEEDAGSLPPASAPAGVHTVGAAPPDPAAYIPTAISRATAASTASASSREGVQAGTSVGDAPPAAAAAAASAPAPTSSPSQGTTAPAVNLEDELRALQARRAADSNGHAIANGAVRRGTGGTGRGSAGSESDSDPEVIILGRETADPSLLLPPHHHHHQHQQQQTASRRALSLAHGRAEDGEVEADADGGVQGGAGVGGAGAPSCLPGECVDTRAEEAYWRAMHGLGDGLGATQHMLEQLGLAQGPDEGEEEEGRVAVSDGPVHDKGRSAAATSNGSGSGHVPSGAVGEEAPTANGGASRGAAEANGHTALAAAAGSSSGGVDQGAGSAVEVAGQDASELGTAAAASGGSAVGPTERADQRALSPGGANPTASSNEAVQVDAGGSCGGAGAAATAGTGALAAYRGPGSAGPASGAAEGDDPTFESVEAFSLDPDFDYDNVVLTRREWPYTMLNARWPGQAGAGR